MKYKAALTVALLLAVAAVGVIPMVADDSDADNKFEITLKESSYNVTDGREITVILVYKTDTNYNSTVTVVQASNPSHVLHTEKVRFNADAMNYQEYPLKFDADYSGTILIKFSDGVHDDISFNISFKTSIWSQGSTYLVIIVIIILIVALVVYKSRTSTKTKSTLTFEEVEAQKQAAKSAPKEPKKEVKSERQRYLDSKKK